jgi:hypothetical protein
MTTPKDKQRFAAFNQWMERVGGLDAATRITGIARRRLGEFGAGRRPPPASLLEELAEQVDDAALAQRLRDAAEPAEAPHA